MAEFALKLHDPSNDVRAPIERQQAHGTRWLWLDDAARLMNVNEGTLRRRCAKEWHARCLARQERRPNGQLAWQVSELADAALAPAAPPPAAGEVDLTRLTDKQRAEFSRRNRILQGWRDAQKAGATIGMDANDVTDRYIAKLAGEGIKTSRGSIYRLKLDWDRARGPKGLLDRRWSCAVESAPPADDRFAETLKRLYLHPNRRSISRCADMAAEDAGLKFTDALYKAAQRIIAAIPREQVILRREGEDAFTNEAETAIDRDYSRIAANQIWVADHHRFDVWVQVVDPATGELKNVRPWLHAWQDMRSRKIVGYSIFAHDPNAQVIVRVLTAAIRSCYAPAKVYLDNGKDFDSRILTGETKQQRRRRLRDGDKPALDDGAKVAIGGVLSILDIKVEHAWPYHGQSKPIERWFNTVSSQFSKDWDTYCGRDPSTRPDGLQGRLDAGRAPMFDDFCDAFDHYVRDRCNGHAHLGDSMNGRTPDEVWAATIGSRVVIADELLDFARLTRVSVRVRQKAVVRLPGLEVSYGRGERELIDRMGQDVVIAYDPDHLGTAFLCDPKTGQAICKLAARDKLSPDATEQELRPHIGEKKTLRRRAREFNNSRPKLGLDVPELARMAAARRATETREAQRATGTDSATALAAAPIGISRTPIAAVAESVRTVVERPTGLDPDAVRAALGGGGAFGRIGRPPDDDEPLNGDAFSILGAALARREGRDE